MSHGAFFKTDVGPTPIELLLDRADFADAADVSAVAAEGLGVVDEEAFVPARPRIEEFLDEEDITRECRGDNKRLITFLCRPEVVTELVALCLNIGPFAVDGAVGGGVGLVAGGGDEGGEPSVDPPETEEGTAQNLSPAAVAAMTMGGGDVSATEELQKKRFTRSYIASELLSADVRPLADALVGEDQVFDSLFSCLETNAEGELDTFVASHFAKIISSLLKTRNDETLAQMTRRRPDFVTGLLKHLNLPAIAELIVRILDGPELDRGYSQVIVAPSTAALDLLVVSDILTGLGDKFVSAAKPANGHLKDEPTDARRLREETMTHTTLAIQGIATRVLQLPALGFAIPALLSPYATPAVVMRMLNAGLDAYYAEEGAVASTADGDARSGGGVASKISAGSTSGAHAALLHALSLVATLLTTEDNVVQDEASDKGGVGGGMAGGVPGAGNRMMLGMGGGRGRGYPTGSSGRAGGIGASIQAARERENREAAMNGSNSSDEDDDDDDDTAEIMASVREAEAAEAAAEQKLAYPEHADDSPEVGCPIVSTALLEGELVGVFDRLSQMFLTHSHDEAKGRPLGSLRLKLAEFFVACMKNSSQSTVDAIVSLGVPQKLLELFLRYEWSSMLHGVVTLSVVSAFSGDRSCLPARKAWVDAKLVSWITSAWEMNERRAEEEELRYRAGYMGHLIRMGAELQHYLSNQESLEDRLAFARELLFSDQQLSILSDFADNHLGPAIQVEMTALCEGVGPGGSEGEEVYEEATEVFDMGVMDGLNHGEHNQALTQLASYLMHRSDVDDEEVETVELGEVEDVGDLSHFGADDDDEVREVNFDGDHDIPPEMRAAMQSSSETAAPPPVAPPPALDRMAFMGGANPEVISEVASPLPSPLVGVGREVNAHDLEQPSIVDSEVTSMDFEGGGGASPKDKKALEANSPKAAFGYSSDEDGDGGTYEEFVDAPGEIGDLSSAMANQMKITGRSEHPPAAPAYDPRVVTEIDDADGHVTVIDDADDGSSGSDDAGEWIEFKP